MAQDRWRDRDPWRDDERRRWEEDEGRRFGRNYGQGESEGYGHGRDYGRERYEEDGYWRDRPARGFEPTGYPGTGGFGYIPARYPEERRFGGEYGRGRSEPWERGFGTGRGGYGQDRPGRGYEETYRRGGEQERGWWDRARDEMYSWMGDEGAEQRRRADAMRSGHYGRGPKGYTRSDERIREDVSDRLTDDWRVDASNIEVSVSNGEVTLSGTVDSREAKRRAEDCVENVSGVRNVQNNIRVQQPGDAGGAFGSSASGTTGAGIAASARSNK